MIQTFLQFASRRTVDELQAFTAQWVPTPTWVKTENVDIPPEHVSKAANAIITQLGPEGVKAVGGKLWWQWRRNNSVLRAEWIEMQSHYLERKRDNKKGRRVMLYVHGGGYFFGSVDEHRYQMQRHARKLKARVIAPRYRLAPQFPFPCGLQDCLAVYLYLLSQHAPNEIILAGDSAGGGMVVSMLCILRDQHLPLPAGAVLISPWVDLTHSFPSVSEINPLDYIPAHGFHHKPSVAWPPPNDDDAETIRKLTQENSREEAVVAKTTELASELGMTAPDTNDPGSKTANRVPAPGQFLSIEMDGRLVVVKEQIQMYAANQLLSHPLVSPVLQPSLGGLPPLLILVGGGEMLRDEQMYLAHKAANPHKYPLPDAYRKYDPGDKLLDAYKATPVQLQVWEDLCHVAPTLSFTRPAKYMYRSIAQFGAWALARAQDRPIEIMDDDNISIISTESNSDSPNESTDSIAKMKIATEPQPKFIGRAGDPLPFFHNHMIRQLVDRHGNISDLPSSDELPATTMNVNEVGLIKPGPVKKWMEAKDSWASKYASTKRKVQKLRIDAIKSKHHVPFEADENPPASSLAARRTAREVEKKQRKSYGLAMWSMWGSKHDEATMRREDEMDAPVTDSAPTEEQVSEVTEGQFDGSTQAGSEPGSLPTQERSAPVTSPSLRPRRPPRRSLSRGSKSRPSLVSPDDAARSRSRRRTITVTDRGQANAEYFPLKLQQAALPSFPNSSSQLDNSNIVVTPPPTADANTIQQSSQSPTQSTTEDRNEATASNANPLFLPKFRNATHLRDKDVDTMSTRTGYSALSVSGASTRAVFSAPGVSKVTTIDGQPFTSNEPSSAGMSETSTTAANNIIPSSREQSSSFSDDFNGSTDKPSSTPTPTATTFHAITTIETAPTLNGTTTGAGTPGSRRSIERLQTHQQEYEREVHEEAVRRLSLVNSGGIPHGDRGESSGPERAKQKQQGLETGNRAAEDGDEAAKLPVPQSHTLRSPSSVAIVGAEGVVGIVGKEL